MGVPGTAGMNTDNAIQAENVSHQEGVDVDEFESVKII
jgi:hypothetical protein